MRRRASERRRNAFRGDDDDSDDDVSPLGFSGSMGSFGVLFVNSNLAFGSLCDKS